MSELTLQEQLNAVETKLSAERDLGSQKDAEKIAILEQQQAELHKAISDQEQEAAQMVRIAEQEERIESEPIPFQLAGVDLSALPVEFIEVMERIIKIDRRNMAEGPNKEIQRLIDASREDGRAWAERELQLKRQNDSLQHKVYEQQDIITNGKGANAELVREIGDLRDHIAKVNFEKDDSDSKRDAAMAELDGVKLELEMAREEIQQMRAADHYGESKAQKIIDITPEETSEIQNLVNNLAKKLVTVNAIGGNWKEVVYDDGSKQVVHANDVAKLEEVLPFRTNELDQANVESSTAAPTLIEVVPPEVTFPDNFPLQSGDEVDTGVASEVGQVSETVTRSEFEALKADVEVLKRRNGMVA